MELIQILAPYIFGGGALGVLLFFDSRRRKERAEARTAELLNVDTILKQKDGYIADLKTELEEAKVEKKELREEASLARENEAKERDKVTGLYKQISEKNVEEIRLREEVVKLQYYRCEVPDCKRRTPPRFETEVNAG